MYDHEYGYPSNDYVDGYEVHYSDAEGYPCNPYITVGEDDITVEPSEIETDSPLDWA